MSIDPRVEFNEVISETRAFPRNLLTVEQIEALGSQAGGDPRPAGIKTIDEIAREYCGQGCLLTTRVEGYGRHCSSCRNCKRPDIPTQAAKGVIDLANTMIERGSDANNVAQSILTQMARSAFADSAEVSHAVPFLRPIEHPDTGKPTAIILAQGLNVLHAVKTGKTEGRVGERLINRLNIAQNRGISVVADSGVIVHLTAEQSDALGLDMDNEHPVIALVASRLGLLVSNKHSLLAIPDLGKGFYGLLVSARDEALKQGVVMETNFSQS